MAAAEKLGCVIKLIAWMKRGYCTFRGHGYVLVDLPGCYSLMAHSAEEEAARDFLCFGGADAAVVVCDATCFKRLRSAALVILRETPPLLMRLGIKTQCPKV